RVDRPSAPLRSPVRRRRHDVRGQFRSNDGSGNRRGLLSRARCNARGSARSAAGSLTMMALEQVSRKYVVGDSDVWALRDATLRIEKGDFVTVMGPSGSGKSTLLQIIGLLDRPTSGHVSFEGEVVDQLDDERRARLRLLAIGFVFQRFHLLANMT